MQKIKVGLLTMSDGREHLHQEYLPITSRYQDEIAKALEASGQYTVVVGGEPIHNNEMAKTQARACARRA